MVGFFSDLREMCEAAGNRAFPKRPGAFGGMSPDETIWVDKLIIKVRLSWYNRTTLKSSNVRILMVLAGRLTMNPLSSRDDLATMDTTKSARVRLMIVLTLNNDQTTAHRHLATLATDMSAHRRLMIIVEPNDDHATALHALPPTDNMATTATTRSVHRRLMIEINLNNDHARVPSAPPPLPPIDDLAAGPDLLNIPLMILSLTQSETKEVVKSPVITDTAHEETG